MTVIVTDLKYTELPLQFTLPQLFDHLPDSVLWVRAVNDQAGQPIDSSLEIEKEPHNPVIPVIDFVVGYANPKAQHTAISLYQISAGTSIRYGNPGYSALSEQVFGQLCAVFERDRTTEFECFEPILDQWFWVTISRAGAGVLITARVLTMPTETTTKNERQRMLLDRIFNASPNAVFIYEAIRDQHDQIVDFAIQLANERGRVEGKARFGVDVVGKTWLSLEPDARGSNQFLQFCQVAESGQPIHTERFYPDTQVWFNTSITKMKDGVVVMENDITQQKQTALETERQRTLLEGILNASQDVILVLEPIHHVNGPITDFRITHANATSTQLLEQPVDELLTHTLLEICPEIRRNDLFGHLQTVAQTGEPYQGELLYNRVGAEIWYKTQLVKLDKGLVLTLANLTQVRQTEQTIKESAANLQAVVDIAQAAIFLITPTYNEAGKLVDFRFRTANQMIASYVGQEPEALTGELVSRWFPEYLTNGLFRRYVAIFETGRTQHFTFHFETDTIDSWENYTVVKVGNDVLVTFSDFTELKKLQQRIEASATELQTVIDTCQTGIFLFSPERNLAGDVVDFRFRLANRQLASYVGQEPDVVVGALGSTWFPGYKTNGLFDIYHKTYITGESQRFDFHYNNDGIDVWLDIMTTKSGDDVLVTFGDYTPLKRLQQQLESSVIDLQRSNKNLEQFAYVASHDLQEPLRKIQAFGDIIQSQFAPVIGENGADIIARMQSAAARMQVLIKDVLAYSRIATKRENIGLVNLTQVVDEVLTDIERAIVDKQAVLHVGSLPTVRGDAAQLRQLFQNLISNALKFTKVGALVEPPSISITSHRVYGRDLVDASLLNTDADKEFYLIEVRDNGIGFDPHQAERIFQVFQRLHGRSEYQGTGIGLAIVQKVIDNHQGYILAEGRPGQGATFRILLPV